MFLPGLVMKSLKHFIFLARLDKPVGIFLLFLPCLSGLFWINKYDSYWSILFLIGSILLRGAGCTINDLIDRNIDKKVERTKDRPIASGKITVLQGLIFFLLQCFAGLFIFLYLSFSSKIIALIAFVISCIYPLSKRYTNYPQFVLGISFNSGFLIAISQYEKITINDILFYLGAVFFTVAYDSIYAVSDKKYDELIGVKSVPVKFGKNINFAVMFFYIISFSFFVTSFIYSDLSKISVFILILLFCFLINLFLHQKN